MKKKLFTLLLTLTLILSLSVPAFAAQPEGDKDASPTVELLNSGTIYLGDTVTLKATTLKHGNKIDSESWTHVETSETYLGLRTDLSIGDVEFYVNTLSFTPTAVGTYTFTYMIRMTSNDKNYWSGTDSVDFIVELKTTIVVENQAAPAVANAILKENNISHRYLISGKNFGNYISDVAKAMENEAKFNGVSKDKVEEYKAAVYKFLKDKGADLD